MFEAVVDYLLGVQEFRSAGVQTLPDQAVKEFRSIDGSLFAALRFSWAPTRGPYDSHLTIFIV
jgi:hypothetical protein